MAALLRVLSRLVRCSDDRPPQRSDMPVALFSLPCEVRDKIYLFYFEDARFKIAIDSIIPANKQGTALGLLLVCHQIRDEAYRIFLSTSTFKIDLAWYNKIGSDHHNIYMRNLVIDERYIRDSLDTIKERFPSLRLLQIHYHPKTTTNFESLQSFAVCKNFCCNNDFKTLLLNALFYRDGKDDRCWISSFKGKRNKDALKADTKLEIRLIMKLKTDAANADNKQYLVGSPSGTILLLGLHS